MSQNSNPAAMIPAYIRTRLEREARRLIRGEAASRQREAGAGCALTPGATVGNDFAPESEAYRRRVVNAALRLGWVRRCGDSLVLTTEGYRAF